MKKRLLFVGIFTLASLLIITLVYAKNGVRKPMAEPEPNALQQPEIQHTDNTQVASNVIQIALILDTSNSMDGLINQAKSQLWNIVNELSRAQKDSSSAKISIALYEYGNNGLSVSNGYIRQVLPFTTDLDELSAKLFALSTFGGEEYCGQVIQTSLNELEWSTLDSSLKVIYIAGNEEFNQGEVNYSTACSNANTKDVVINTIFCGKYNLGIRSLWKHGADLGKGKYMNIDSDKAIVMVSTPYDDQINRLNVQLNNTYITYGSEGRKYKARQREQDNNQMKISKSNMATRAVSKSSHMYSNSSWDLLDGYQSDKNIVNTVDKSTLPDSLSDLTSTQLDQFIIEKTKERNKLQADIMELGAKRELFIAQAKDSTSSSETLGDRLVVSVREQAKTKGFTFQKK